MHAKHEIDMTTGSLPIKITQFALPLMLTGIMQLTFNACDNIVVGQFAGSNSLAAVSSTGPITSFAINMFNGLAVGTNMILAGAIGAGNKRECEDTVHTSIALSMLLGIIIGTIGCIFCPQILRFVNTPKEIEHLTSTYLRIYFAGAPAILVYSFGSAIMRSTGDTRRPLYYLSISGVVNIVLNLILVIKFRLDTAGVAIATTVSNYLSAALIIFALRHTDSICRLDLSKIRIIPSKVMLILKYGIPASIQSLMFSISNISIQSSVNSFGPKAIAGCGAAGTIEGFAYVSMNSIGQAALAFSGQNLGAGKIKRIKHVLINTAVMVIILSLVMLGLVMLLSDPLIKLFIPDDAKAVDFAFQRLMVTAYSYILCGFMEITVGSLRGLGKSLLPALLSIVGICGIRLVWIETVFREIHTLNRLYISYPVTWGVTSLMQFICFIYAYRSIKKSLKGKINGKL